MAHTYAGVSTAITAATNATPIVVTANAHGHANGDVVSIAGVLGNTAANGEWVVAAAAANSFALTSSVGNGAWTSGGTVTSFAATASLPDDITDQRSAASVNSPFQTLADRCQMLYRDFKQRMLGMHPIVPALSVTRVQESTAYALPANWAPNDAAQKVTNLVIAKRLYIPVALPHGSTWTGYSVAFSGATGHGAFPGGAPANMPTTTPLKIALATGTEIVCSGFANPTTDASATAAVYEAIHQLSDTAGTEVVDRTLYRYVISLLAEGGANGIVGDVFYAASTTVKTIALDPRS